jgi:hypothetical protein
MKKYRLAGLIVFLVISMSLTVPGFMNITFSIFLKTGLRYGYWWLIGAIGIFFYVIFLFWAIISIFKERQPSAVVQSRIRSLAIWQIIFSFVNVLLGLSIGILSTVFALYALSEAVNAKNEISFTLAERQLKTAKSFNIVAVVLVAVQWLAIILLLSSIKRGQI